MYYFYTFNAISNFCYIYADVYISYFNFSFQNAFTMIARLNIFAYRKWQFAGLEDRNSWLLRLNGSLLATIVHYIERKKIIKPKNNNKASNHFQQTKFTPVFMPIY